MYLKEKAENVPARTSVKTVGGLSRQVVVLFKAIA